MAIYGYHSRRGRGDRSKGAKYKFGIEIEKDGNEINRNFLEHQNTNLNGWVAERDGSLQVYGYELVSPKYDLMNTKVFFSELKPLHRFIHQDNSRSCGGHISISSTEENSRSLLENRFRGYLPLLYALYKSRVENSYCAARRADTYSGKMNAFNPTSSRLEIRLFPSPRYIKSIRFRLELIKYILEYPAKTPDKVLERLYRRNSKLYRLLLSVYEPSELVRKVNLMVTMAKQYDNDELDVEKISRVLVKAQIG